MCKKTFANKRLWDSHEKKHHLGQCHICEIEISDLEMMRLHHRKDHRKSQAKCPGCSCNIFYSEYGKHNCHQHYKSTEDRYKHQVDNRKARTKLRIYSLKEGEKMENVKAMTFEFMGVTDGQVKWYCGHCKQEFSTKRDLRKHIKSTHDNQVFKCDICDSFTSGFFDPVVNHKAKRHGVATDSYELFRCSVETCDFMCSRQSEMDSHMRNLHAEETKADRTCKVCSKELSCPFALKQHVESVHMRMEKFKCTQCNKGFVAHTTLKTHMKKRHDIIIVKDVPVMCSICGKLQRNQIALRNHMNFHSGPKKCEICEKVLKNIGTYKSHKNRYHSGKTTHNCTKCDKSYSAKYRLFLHVKRDHEGLRPWTCKLCNKDFMVRKEAAVHIGTIHENWSTADAKQNYLSIIENQHPALIRNKLSDSSDEEK